MAIEVIEKPDSRESSTGKSASVDLKYLIIGTDDDLAAKAALADTAPDYYDGLVRQSRHIVPIGDPTVTQSWEGTVRYGLNDYTPPATGESTFSFDTGGGTQHITQSLTTIASYVPSGMTAPNFQGAIGVTANSWEQVQAIFQENNRIRGNSARCRTPAILKGLLRCGHCDGAFGITYSNKNGRNYRYYHCVKSTNSGDASCPIPNVPAAEIEAAVVSQLRELLRAPETLAAAHQAWAEQGTPTQEGGADVIVDTPVADRAVPDQKAFARALADIDAVWDHLYPAEQVRICRLLIDKATLYPDRIPAWAGVTYTVRICLISCKADPRVGGGDELGDKAALADQGRSPRGRG